MAVVNPKVRALRPSLQIDVLSLLWRQQICDNAHSVFVVISYKALISVSGISSDNPSSFLTCFGWVIVWNDDLVRCLNISFIKVEQLVEHVIVYFAAR